ncbi:MAG: helix-turn-helix transcriptional regulator [Eubacteriales bacterium]
MNDSEITVFVGRRIKEMRTEAGLTQKALAQKAGVDRSYIVGIENAKRNVSLETLDRICRAMDENVFEIFSENVDYSQQK